MVSSSSSTLQLDSPQRSERVSTGLLDEQALVQVPFCLLLIVIYMITVEQVCLGNQIILSTISATHLEARCACHGGHGTARSTWMDYFATFDGIIFLVDAAYRLASTKRRSS